MSTTVSEPSEASLSEERTTPDVHLSRLARTIRALREARGLTQEDFARASDISASFASLLERGERSPSYETLLQVASALDVPLAELFVEPGDDERDAGEERLARFARERGLARADVDRLLAVAEAMFREPNEPPTEPMTPRQGGHCTEPTCTKQALARGLCIAHYHRARRARR